MDLLGHILASLEAPQPTFAPILSVWLLGVQVLQKLPNGDVGENGPFVLLTCKTRQGATLTVIITDWLPWFRVVGTSNCLDTLQRFKSRNIKSMVREAPRIKACGFEPTSLSDFSCKRHESIKITVTHLYGIDYAIKDLKQGVKGFGDPPSDLEATDTCHRAPTRFLNDLNLRTCAWFSFKCSAFIERQITIGTEVRCRCADIMQSSEEASCLDVPPLRLASFDGEMSSFSRRFPSAFLGDKAFCLSTSLSIYPSLVYTTITLYLHPLRNNTQLKLSDTHHLLFFSKYRELLEAWTFLITRFDCDIGPTGWNTESFDWPFFVQSYQQLFEQESLRGTEALHLEIWKQCGTPRLSVRELIAKLSNAQLKEIRLSVQAELSDYGYLLDSLLCVRKDSSTTLLQDDAVEEEEEEISYLPPKVHLILRKYIEHELGIASAPEWKPTRQLFESLYKKFGSDAARLMTSAAEQGPRQAMFLSRLRHKECKLEIKRMTTAAKGDNIRELVQRDGAIVFDMMRVYKDSEKPNSMALKVAAEQLQGINKLDMPYEDLFEIYDVTRALKPGDDDSSNLEDIKKVAEYCARDAEIPLRLLAHLKYVEGWVGLSRVCNLPLDAVINGGQQARVFSELSWGTRHTHLLNHPSTGWPDNSTKYQGATVMEPIAGFYDTPLSTLDFASLYPSVMSAHNLCPSTLVKNPRIADALRARGMCMDFTIQHEGESGVFSQTYTFASHVPSILSQLLQGLLAQRKTTKKLMESEEDPTKREILNKLQLAYKVVCNSAYGYCGSTAGSIWGPFFPVAAATTLGGRSYIASTKVFIEKMFDAPQLKGQRPVVVYGDTDSVMIKWPNGTTLDDAFWMGEQASREVTNYLRDKLLEAQHKAKGFGRDPSEMVKVLKLEHEKEMFPALMCREKKNYAYRCWTPKSYDTSTLVVQWKVKTDIKGLQCVRRDAVPYYSKLMLRILDYLLLERNAPKALEDVHTTLLKLMNNELPIEDLVVSKSVASHYKVQQVHIEARKRMEERGEDIPPVGGRMPFIIVAQKRGGHLSLAERAQHPEYVAKLCLKPDLSYYLKASFSALRKLYQSFDTDKLESILSAMISKAENQGSKRLLSTNDDSLASALNLDSNAKKPKKTERKTRIL